MFSAKPDTWDESINTHSYDKVESLSNFATADDLDKYKALQISKSTAQCSFIKKECYNGKKIRFIEYCSGNSRLLYALNAVEILQSGIGIEISKTRHTFAESWRKQLGIQQATISNVNGDAIDCHVISPCADVALCVTGAFQYFAPRRDTYENIFLSMARRSLVPGGILILEIYNHPTEIAGCMMSTDYTYRSWIELPESDPFRYYLTHYMYLPAIKALDAKEIFVKRDGFIDDTKREVLRIYSASEIFDLLDNNGFKMTGYYSDWNKAKGDASADKSIIVAEAV